MSIEIDKLSTLARDYNATFTQMTLIESELTKELQKFVSWDVIQVSFTGGGVPVVKAQNEYDAVPLADFIAHIKKHGIVSDIAYGHLAYI